MSTEDLKALRVSLKTGEYNGVDIMKVWIAIDELIEAREFIEKAFVAHPNLDMDVEAI